MKAFIIPIGIIVAWVYFMKTIYLNSQLFMMAMDQNLLL